MTRIVLLKVLELGCFEVDIGVGQGIKHPRHGIFKNGKTMIEVNQLISHILAFGIESAKHHFAGERGEASGAVSIRGSFEQSKFGL